MSPSTPAPASTAPPSSSSTKVASSAATPAATAPASPSLSAKVVATMDLEFVALSVAPPVALAASGGDVVGGGGGGVRSASVDEGTRDESNLPPSEPAAPVVLSPEKVKNRSPGRQVARSKSPAVLVTKRVLASSLDQASADEEQKPQVVPAAVSASSPATSPSKSDTKSTTAKIPAQSRSVGSSGNNISQLNHRGKEATKKAAAATKRGQPKTSGVAKSPVDNTFIVPMALGALLVALLSLWWVVWRV